MTGKKHRRSLATIRPRDNSRMPTHRAIRERSGQATSIWMFLTYNGSVTSIDAEAQSVSREGVGDGLVTRPYHVGEQTLYQRDEFAKTMVVLSLEGTPVPRDGSAPRRANQVLPLTVLFYRLSAESLQECPALVGNGGAFKICTRHSCLRS